MTCLSRVLFALTLASAAGAETPGPDAPRMRWAHTWKEALEEAKIRNVPILIAIGSDS